MMDPLNGRMPVDRLVAVQGPIMLERATATAYLAMKAAAKREGITVEIPTPAGGYRSWATQIDMHENPEDYNLDPNSVVSLAPVGYSTHGRGDRVDIIVGDARRWAINNAHHFGFEREFGAADPGHFCFTGTAFAGLDVTPIQRGRPAMPLPFRVNDRSSDLHGRVYLFDHADLTFTHIQAQADKVQRGYNDAGIPTVEITAAVAADMARAYPSK